MHTRILTLLVLLAAMTPAVIAANAQPAQITFDSTPTRLDALGLSVILPTGSQAEISSFGSNATMGVELPQELGVMVIKGQSSTNDSLTSGQVVDSIIDQLRRSNGTESFDGTITSTSVTVIDRTRNLAAGTLRGERVYLEFPALRDKPALVRGFTVFRVEPRKFVIFDLMTELEHFARARPLYETTVGTLDVSTLDNQAQKRARAIKNSQRVMGWLTPERLRELAERYPERWERLHTPAASGDEMDDSEHGYRRIRVAPGMRGELSGRPEGRWRPSDRVPGFIVKLDAMALDSGLRVDTRAVYFVSEDGQQEAWTVNMALRQGETSTESSIAGARSGTSMTVQLEQPGATPQVTKPVIQGEGYLPQAIAQLMVPALVRHGEPGSYAFYAYNTRTNSITLRTDEVSMPESSPGLTVVRSRPDADTPAAAHFYNAKGDLIRTELHNRRVWEPIQLDRLVRLWQRKGLPLE